MLYDNVISLFLWSSTFHTSRQSMFVVLVGMPKTKRMDEGKRKDEASTCKVVCAIEWSTRLSVYLSVYTLCRRLISRSSTWSLSMVPGFGRTERSTK